MKKSHPDVVIHTDGAHSSKTGIGGFAAVMESHGSWQVVYGKETDTTNNRMEMIAALSALECLPAPCVVQLISDSKNVVDGIKHWLPNWQRNNWRKANGQPVSNRDLWDRMVTQLDKHTIQPVLVKGHNGDPGNELADWYASRAAGTRK